MAENKMKEVAELLGIEMDKPFNIKGYKLNPCKLTSDRIINKLGDMMTFSFFKLITGELEIEQPILGDVEKRYLENVLRPFKSRVISISKSEDFDYEYILIRVELPIYNHGNTTCKLPYFDKGTMYKGMELDEQYSLEELGLFEGNDE